jgi:hypothetical protein
MTPRHLLITGLLLSALALALIAVAPIDALRAWLAAAFLWSGVPIGSLGFLMMIRLIGGRWGHSLLPFFEAGALTLPIAAVAMVPVLAGMTLLYPWVGAAIAGFKGVWLSPLPFVVRTLILFAGLGLLLRALVTRRGSAVVLSSAGLLFLAPMMSIVSVDWLVSLDTEFHSSGFGLYTLSIQFTVALMAAIWALLGRQPDRTETLSALLITLILLWIYLAFTSYIIVWSGDLASVVGWYKVRGTGGWGIAIAIAAVIEAVAFLILLSPTVRHSARWLRAIALAMILGKVLEAAWLVLPQGGAVQLVPVALYVLAVVGLGLIFLSAQSLLLDRRIAERLPA